MMVGAARPVSARVLDASGAPVSGAEVFWSSEHPAIATVTPEGIVTGVAQGKTQIAASSNGTSGVMPVSVSRLPVSLVRINPAAADVIRGSVVVLAAQALDATGGVVPGHPVTWTSSNTAVATVNGNGGVTGVALGSAVITATLAGLNGTAVITVRRPPVATVTVSPATATVSNGKSVQLAAGLKDANGNVLTGPTVSWSALPAGIVTVNSTGRVTGTKRGKATVTATSEGKSGTSQVTVR